MKNQNITKHAIVIVPGHGPEALLWIIVDAFLLVAIVTGNSLSISIILRSGRRRRNRKSIVKERSQQRKTRCSNRKQPQNEMGLHSSEHERKGPEEMARNCRKPSPRSACFVFSLAISDLLVGLAMPFHMTFYIQGVDGEGSIHQSEGITLGEIEWTCLLRFVLIALACSASACNLMAIAVDRYLAIVYPLHYNRYMNKRVAATIIFSCWVSALLFATVPAYWNRWKTAASCELDEIFTPQYITCVVPPLFSAVVVALTILYWRIGKEARSQLSRFLGADGKGPPWRRRQSGKTYSPLISSNDNQQENSRILNPQDPTDHRNDCEEQKSQPKTSEPTKELGITQRTANQALQQSGLISNTNEGKNIKYKDERLEENNEYEITIRTLYKIEEENDLSDNEELDPISSNDAVSYQRNDQKLDEHQTNQDRNNPMVSGSDEAKMDVIMSERGQGNIRSVFGYLERSDKTNNEILQIENNVSTDAIDEYKRANRKDLAITNVSHENPIALNICPNRCIARAIKNLKGHFHTITPGSNSRRNQCNSHATVTCDSYKRWWKLNNIQALENMGTLPLNISNIIKNQNPKVINQMLQFKCNTVEKCQNTPVEECQNRTADQESGLKNDSDMKRNHSQSSGKSELILCANSLDMTNKKAFKYLTNVEDKEENKCNMKAHCSTSKDDVTKLLIRDFNSESVKKSENDHEEKLTELTRNDNGCTIPDSMLKVETSMGPNGLRNEDDNKKSPSMDVKPSSSMQRDKNEHYQAIRSSSCSSQEDPPSNAWTIRFPSLTSAGTTVRPLSKSTIVVLLVLGSFVLLWLPYIVVCALLVNGIHLPYNIYRATFSLAMSNSGVNPVIYGWKNAELKRVFLRFILKKWHKCYSKFRKEEQTGESEMNSRKFTEVSFGTQRF